MRYQQFNRLVEQKLYHTTYQVVSRCYNHNVSQTVDNKIFIDNKQTNFSSLEEAKQFIRQEIKKHQITQQLEQDNYNNTSLIAEIVSKYHPETKITNSLIEQYTKIASSKQFSCDDIIVDIRNLHNIVENRVDFVLKDHSKVLISNEMWKTINTLFKEHKDIIDNATYSSRNFLDFINLIKG